MLKTPYYYYPIGRQDISDEDEPINHSTSCHLDPPEREIVMLFNQCIGLLDVNAKDFSVIHETVQTNRLDTLIGTRVSLTIKESQRNGYTNYNVIRLDFRPNFKPATKRRPVQVLPPLSQVLRTLPLSQIYYSNMRTH